MTDYQKMVDEDKKRCSEKVDGKMNTYLTTGYYYVSVQELPNYSFRCDTRMIFWFRTKAEFEEVMRNARRSSLVMVTK